MSLSVVIVGHIDHGKSTLIGRLLYDSEALPQEKIAEIQKVIEEYRKRFEFAYFLDSYEEELKEERTIDTTRVLFKGKRYYTIVDVPGHKEFIKNMLSGACHAQVGILVVSAPNGVEEQTRRHSFLLHMLGITKMVVAINKMDLMDYHEEPFQKLKDETSRLLSSLGFSNARFVPVSALEGDNVFKPSLRMQWYQGPTLIEALDGVEIDPVTEKPLRFVVQDTYSVNDSRITVGRVESGNLRKGDQLTFEPDGVRSEVKAIKVYGTEKEVAESGDSIGIVLSQEVGRGNVGGHLASPPRAIRRFIGEVVLLQGMLNRGDRLELKCGTRKTTCLAERLRERISSETGEVIGINPQKIEENEAATIIFDTEPLVVEKFSDIPELGRFVLVKGARNVGAGVILETNASAPE
jgi:small GTP-binding protein